MIGKTISHYKILEKLGEGGMGVVYKAQDLKLDRHVALKFLPPHLTHDDEAKKRFIHEAKAASALDHLNICNVHEIDETSDGQMFIAMAYYDGQNLRDRLNRGPLDTREALDIVSQVTTGLAKAHEKDIVHRDIKPANILITTDGVVKIVDFGLAKLKGRTKVTKTGTTVGTVAYMSPEQARGEEVDHRSDIWSLGVVLYELLTGQALFKGDHEAAVLYSIMNEDLVPIDRHNPSLPDSLNRVIYKALEKMPENRYQSIQEFLADLSSGSVEGVHFRAKSRKTLARTLALSAIVIFLAVGAYTIVRNSFFSNGRMLQQSASGEPVFVVAVTPFFWGEDRDAMAEGRVMQALIERKIHEELGSEVDVRILGKDITDIPRSHEEARALGKRHEAKIVIWGEVLVLRDEVSIQSFMTVVKPSYSLTDQSTSSLVVSLTKPDQLALRKAMAAEVGNMALIVAGVYHCRDDNPEKALLVLQRVSPPTSGSLRVQAFTYVLLNNYEEAIRLYNEAIELDPRDAWVRAHLGDMYRGQGKLEAAIEQYKIACDLNPELAYARHNLGLTYDEQGKDEAAIMEYQKAIKLDPDFDWPYNSLGIVYHRQGKYEEAIAAYKKATTVNPEYEFAYENLVSLYVMQGKYEAAIAEYKKAIELNTGSAYAYFGLGALYTNQGKFNDAARILRIAAEKGIGDSFFSLSYFVAMQRIGNAAEAEVHISKVAQTLESDAWIAPVVRFYAGEITEEAVLKAAESDDEQTDNEQKCEVYYYVGMAHLVGATTSPDKTRAAEYFEKCLETNVTEYLEYDWAKNELERIRNP